MKIRLSRLDAVVLFAVILCGAAGFFALIWLVGSSDIVIMNNPERPADGPAGVLRGEPCDAHDRRPVAVMLASDPEARPLSGIGAADMVFEMPVTPDGITRIMAVFQCTMPDEIGSIRSARRDFIPLAQGLDAVFVHWGGERDALADLDGGIIDNIDALKFEGTTFYRKSSAPRPHNGFTTPALLRERADMFGYRATTSLQGPPRTSTGTERSLGSVAETVSTSWPQGMGVTFTYDATSNTYRRERGGEPETDRLSGRQAEASVVILMQSEATFLRDQYISVDTVGNGTATIWQGGHRTNALWQKESPTAMLRFTDGQGNQIPLERGTVWVLIDAPLPTP